MNRIQHRIVALALSLTLLGLATACGATANGSKAGAHVASGGGVPAASAGGQQLTVTVGNSMSFAPASLTVKAGQPVEITLVNDGALAHDFTLTEGVSSPFKLDSPGGQTTRATFTVERAGTYSFVCSVPGHAPLGMRGRLVVQ
jgi:uncharacterized cupredoxin-like copper-binding protein